MKRQVGVDKKRGINVVYLMMWGVTVQWSDHTSFDPLPLTVAV